MAIAFGAFLNAAGILLGAIFGMARRETVSARAQIFFRNALGTATIFLGLRLAWLNINGTFLSCAKQISVAMLAVMLGNLLGKLLRLQKISNRAGHYASNLIAVSQKSPSQNAAEGFNACTILFCASPLGIIGAIVDGLSGYFWLLAVKAVMDALAMTAFVKLFRWPAAMSAFAVLLFFGAITFVCQFYVAPFFKPPLINAIHLAAGFIALAVAIVIFGTRKVELTNYLPALIIAPLLAHFF
jgi:uncharacterized membrane protein YqgA involved in biofilm formation